MNDLTTGGTNHRLSVGSLVGRKNGGAACNHTIQQNSAASKFSPAVKKQRNQPSANGTMQLSGHRVQRGQFGLKLFQNAGQAIGRFGLRYDENKHEGKIVGPYSIVGEKNRGVEPGFIGRKVWMASDDAKLSQASHKFSTKAETWLRNELKSGDTNGLVRAKAAALLGEANSAPALVDHLKKDPAIKAELADHIMATEEKFTKNHYVKLDYRETEGKGEGDKRTYTLPKSNAKSFGLGPLGKWLHQHVRRQTPDAINRDAMRESVANDLMRSFGIFAQKLKLVPTTYQDGTAKLLLDGTHMTGPGGEKFSDFEGAIKGKSPNGQLVKLDGEGNPIKNERGHYEVDDSVQELGHNKIFMLLLGDRDAIGSKGGNKGRVGNTFAAIDPGHSLELGGQKLMERHDIHSDMSFDQPSRFAGKCYKNFTIFDQCSFSERMEGVRKLQRLAETGADLRVFDDYAAEFNARKQPKMDFEDQIGQMKQAYTERRRYILEDVFADRLAVYDFDMKKIGDERKQEMAKAKTLDVLDSLEKITSKHKWMSGDTELKYPIVTDRTEWKVAENGNTLEFRMEKPSKSALNRLANFVDDMNFNGPYRPESRADGSFVLAIPKSDIFQAFGDFSMNNLLAHDGKRTDRLEAALRHAGLNM